MIGVLKPSLPYFGCAISQIKNGIFCVNHALKLKNQETTIINMVVLGKNKLFLSYLIKHIIMGVGGIVIATVFICIGFLILAEIQERYL